MGPKQKTTENSRRPKMLDLAAEKIRQGKPDAALTMLKTFQKRHRKDSEAACLLAEAHLALGDGEAAAQACQNALAFGHQGAAPLRIQAAFALQSQDLGRAEALLLEARKRDPQDAMMLFQLAELKKKRGALVEALQLYRQALSLNPAFLPGQMNLGNLELSAGNLPAALEAYEAAAALAPNDANTHGGRGMVLRKLGRLDEARKAAENALRLAPESSDALNILANVLKDLGDLFKAESHYRRALDGTPADPSLLYNLADLLMRQERQDEAILYYRQAAAVNPKVPAVWSGLGLALREAGRTAEALAALDAGLAANPGDLVLQAGRYHPLLAAGRFGDAWDAAEAGFDCGIRYPNRRFSVPRWNGEALEGRRLLVWREQGLGDEIRFASVLPELEAQQGEVVIEAEPRLCRIFQRSFLWATVRPEALSQDETRQDIDLEIPLGSLLRFYRRSPADIPKMPYLQADPEKVSFWQQRLASLGPEPKVGVCWRSGLSARAREHERHYAPLESWEPLLSLPGIRFVSLQYGDAEQALADYEAKSGVEIARWSDLDLKDDQDAVFGLASALDLVVSAPTAVAEMAGAVGRPLIVLGINSRESGEPWRPSPWYDAQVLSRYRSESWAQVTGRLADKVGQLLAP